MSGSVADEAAPATLRFGCIGFGRVGRKRAGVLRGLGHRVAAVFDPAGVDDPPAGAAVAASRDALLATPGLDAVVVAAFPVAAADAVSAALDAGLHVFCEKPPGRTLADAEAMAAASSRHPDRVLQFGFNHRHHPALRAARRLVDDGAANGLGRVISARGVYGKAGGRDFEAQWRSDPALAGGGILTDQGIHLVDLLLWFCGPFHSVKAHVVNAYWGIEQEDNAAAILVGDGPDGRSPCFATLHSSATQWQHRFELELGMTGGSVRVDGILSSTGSYGGGTETLTVARTEDALRPASLGRPRAEVVSFDRDDSWEREMRSFCAAVRAGCPAAAGTSRDAVAAMVLLEWIYREGGRGR
ncbi:Gfo/Idh/MocA family protein [Phycisphaera mikurensis]|uniref:Putative oxidoreductase n=1 Tax=Phycisphaera mikurensis (strain NBRC 102666 / KCTC 22515 / FYK2301M01) TaxID=1142394 RepID=I0IBE4_PHYMF|nr:Gfo/Idh/MocA family oxidoreductase [Phycisphaera mikurensis]MBB6442885.1 putative dehydrogenase [Phycisphaera mikurensis]BAM02582.1 putative oxidoreductase [Phycisphaera mikurensis NBRC 102666]